MAGETPGKGSRHRGRSHPANHGSAQNRPAPEQWSVEHLNGRSMPAKIYLLINQGCPPPAPTQLIYPLLAHPQPGSPQASNYSASGAKFGAPQWSVGRAHPRRAPAPRGARLHPVVPRGRLRAAAAGRARPGRKPKPPSPEGFRKPKPPSPEVQSKQPPGHGGRRPGWGGPGGPGGLCRGGSAGDGFPGKIKTNQGLESYLPANISIPHLLL